MSDGGLTGSARVLAILRCLGERPAGARLGEVATAVAAPKSSVHRALAALVDSGFARQDAGGVYHLGFDLLQLVFGYHEAQQVSQTVEPVLRRLADATGETTHYGVLVGSDIVYQAKVSPDPEDLPDELGHRGRQPGVPDRSRQGVADAPSS
jgi:DNA-binding IclR family transcriptional regulator